MVPMATALKNVGGEVRRGVEAELFHGIVDKRPEKPHGAELHGTATCRFKTAGQMDADA